MPVQIDLPSNLPFFDLQVVLDGATYTLEFRWNVRRAAWFMRVYDSQGVTVLEGDHRLVVNMPFPMYVTGRTPPGLFACWDTSNQALDPQLTDLGDRVKLLYFLTSEVT